MAEKKKIDLKKEQDAVLARPRLHHGPVAKFLFWSMDLLYGKTTTLPKVRLLEILARIPYQAWEIRQYGRMNRLFGNDGTVQEAREVIEWGRRAQDNEFWHLRVIAERMKQLGVKESFFHKNIVPPIAVIAYTLFSRMLALVNIRAAYQLNAEFEDHAAHTYMQLVKDHPELDEQNVESEAAKEYDNFEFWGDVFRRIGLDERDHMNASLLHCGRPSEVVPYLD